MGWKGKPRIVSAVGHRCREACVWIRHAVDRLRGRGPVIAFLQGDDLAGRLRARALASAMRALGWAPVLVPMQLELCQRNRILARTRPAVTVLQQHRHPLNDPELLRIATRTVLDIDDADWLDEARRERLERIASKVDLVVAGSRNVAAWARRHNAAVEIVWTTAPPVRLETAPPAGGPTVVTWAPHDADGLPQERAFALRVLALVAERVRFELWVFGVRDMARMRPEFQGLVAQGIAVRLFPLMRYRAFVKALRKAHIGLNPLRETENAYASGKSFGKTLAYLVAGVAVVTTNTVDHPLFFENGRNGFLCETEADWAERIVWLIEHPAERQRLVGAALADYRRRLTPAAAARLWTSILASRFGVRPAGDPGATSPAS